MFDAFGLLLALLTTMPLLVYFCTCNFSAPRVYGLYEYESYLVRLYVFLWFDWHTLLYYIALNTQFGGLNPPVGPVRMKMVELLVALLRSNYPMVYERIASLRLITECIELFFTFEWNNLLHGLVEHVIQMVLSGKTECFSCDCVWPEQPAKWTFPECGFGKSKEHWKAFFVFTLMLFFLVDLSWFCA